MRGKDCNGRTEIQSVQERLGYDCVRAAEPPADAKGLVPVLPGVGDSATAPESRCRILVREPDDVTTDFFISEQSYGKCEVILYSSEHTVTLPELPENHIKKLVDLWAERFVELAKEETSKYIMNLPRIC